MIPQLYEQIPCQFLPQSELFGIVETVDFFQVIVRALTKLEGVDHVRYLFQNRRAMKPRTVARTMMFQDDFFMMKCTAPNVDLHYGNSLTAKSFTKIPLNISGLTF